MWVFLSVVGVVFLLYFFRPHKPHSPGVVSGGSGGPTSLPEVYFWDDCPHFDFEVVGESFYQKSIASIVKARGQGSIVKALLIPDDNNKHDNLAVRVDIDGHTVGHMSRDDARDFRKRLSAKKMKGRITVCDADIRGGGKDRNGKTMLYGVVLRLKTFGAEDDD